MVDLVCCKTYTLFQMAFYFLFIHVLLHNDIQHHKVPLRSMSIFLFNHLFFTSCFLIFHVGERCSYRKTTGTPFHYKNVPVMTVRTLRTTNICADRARQNEQQDATPKKKVERAVVEEVTRPCIAHCSLVFVPFQFCSLAVAHILPVRSSSGPDCPFRNRSSEWGRTGPSPVLGRPIFGWGLGTLLPSQDFQLFFPASISNYFSQPVFPIIFPTSIFN